MNKTNKREPRYREQTDSCQGVVVGAGLGEKDEGIKEKNLRPTTL